MKMLVHVDARDQIADVRTPGTLRLFDNASGVWRVIDEAAFALSQTADLAAIQKLLRGIVERFGAGCAFVSGANRGLVYSLLQEQGFRVWQACGPLAALDLDAFAQRDAELAAARENEARDRAFVALFSSPGGCGAGEGGPTRKRRTPEGVDAVHTLAESLPDGRLRIDLEAVFARYREANSVDVLEPILEARRFSSLEILCDHLPRWFAAKIATLGLVAEITPRGAGVRALVSPAAKS
ncbi:Fe-only nitrogenase accessory protein AnfO [Rhodoblastus acidophilus]|uniref:Fe-only nitrogenase accessory protein AnfO n=1 Tax=Rhodoblastus acidophilus TaxID=1074 RepID=UPI002224567E|nr:Fe-only nitrogenase accessory protein AnfO [Rhodoblastus acidophilus]MCW2318506.1 Fe-only nitrogenase accessory protein AnfO [Rhodoblastus acidophilus]